MSIGLKPCSGCGGKKHRGSILCRKCFEGVSEVQTDAAQTVETDREKRRTTSELLNLRRRYEESLRIIERQDNELRAMNILDSGVDMLTIEPSLGSDTSEGIVVMVASDWHMEESVGAEVNGLNLYTTEIASERAIRFFQHGLRLINLLGQDIKINTIILPLLGDFISNDIHEEFPEINELQPIHALVYAQNHLLSGIQFLLDNFGGRIIVPCHSGNHARTTRTTRFTAENGHSLEYLMYLHLASHFRAEPRVQFIIPDGMHSYLDVYGKIIRLQHGHAIKYGGGVGGIYIPVNKAIAQWNKARHADLDVFGHFHQMRDGGNFICNGSLIGYNAFALSIKADFEEPKQALFVLDKKRGRTATWPILVNQ